MIRQLYLAVFLFVLASTVLAKPQTLPLEYFNQMPAVEQPTISPDGKHVAVILNEKDSTQVAIVPFEDKSKVRVLLQLGGEKFRIDQINWANNERIIVSVSQPLNLMDWKIRVRSNHLYSAKIDGSDTFEMRKRIRDNKRIDFYRNSPYLLSVLRNEPNSILVTLRDERDENYSSVFKVNINNGDFEKYIPNANRIFNWGITSTGEVLLGIGADKDYKSNKSYIYTRKNMDDDWQMVKTFEDFKTETFTPVVFEPKTNSIIVLSDYKLKKQALWRYHIADNNYELLGQAPGQFDIDYAITRLEGDETKVIGFTYNDNFIRRVYFDQNNDNFAQQISNLFSKKGLQASLYDWNRSKDRYVIRAVSDKSPAKFFLFDKNTNKISAWYSQYPQLEQATLANVQPFDFQARDGMQLHGYLTLPNNVSNPPVVVFPHGGPFYVRDSQYFNPFVQMFANQGYAVLQVNFRGSEGFGNEYQTAGYHQWGKKMQTDLVDAFNWLKSGKQVDTSNACIVGASYGGYAALAAGYQTPDLFKCIVSIAGTANMQSTLSHWRRHGHKDYIENAITDNEQELVDLSPVNHAKAFKAPVLLIHGKVDTRVDYAESEDMYNALKSAAKPVDLKLFDFGTHHLDDAVNRKEAMELIASFLDKHLH